MCKAYTGYNGTSEIEHGFYACTVDNYLFEQAHKPWSISHLLKKKQIVDTEVVNDYVFVPKCYYTCGVWSYDFYDTTLATE